MQSGEELILVQKLRERIKSCKLCGGYGYILNAGARVHCECRSQALFEYRMATSGIPPKYRSKSFNDYVYKDSEAYKQVRAYCSDAKKHRESGMGLFLYGPSYTGKSLLACSLLQELMKAGFDCRFLTADLLFNQDSKCEKYIAPPDFLCLDSVGELLDSLTNFREGNVTGDRIHGGAEFLSRFVSKRCQTGKPLIVTCLASLSDINKKFPGLASTLIGSCIQVHCEDKGFKRRRLEQMMGD